MASWTISRAIDWMVDNTPFRLFIGYADPTAHEQGIIYQASQFVYMGDDYGTDWQYKSWRLKQRQSLTLDEKIILSKRRIIEWCEHWDYEVYVSFSGGKDSTVLLDLVRSVYKNCPAVFIDTGVEYPEVRRFAKSQPNVTVLKPKMHFSQVIEEYGYPVISKRISRYVQDIRSKSDKTKTRNLRLTGYTSAGRKCPNLMLPEKWRFLITAPFDISDRCCEILKEGPLDRYMRESGKKPITGEMAVDSQNRRWAYLQIGCNAFLQRNPKSRPLGFWTNQDILQYLRRKMYRIAVKCMATWLRKMACSGARRPATQGACFADLVHKATRTIGPSSFGCNIRSCTNME